MFAMFTAQAAPISTPAAPSYHVESFGGPYSSEDMMDNDCDEGSDNFSCSDELEDAENEESCAGGYQSFANQLAATWQEQPTDASHHTGAAVKSQIDCAFEAHQNRMKASEARFASHSQQTKASSDARDAVSQKLAKHFAA